MSPKAPTRSLTVYLLKESSKPPSGCVKPDPLVERHDLHVGSGSTWHLLLKKSPPVPPRWAPFFDGFINPKVLGESKSSAAVLLARAGEQWFAITFGQGRHILQPWSLEESFGLRVTLNSIGENNLRSIDKETFDAVAGQARMQATRDVPAREFALDLDRDLVRAVTGSPDDLSVASRMTGRDALGITARVELPDLQAFLERIAGIYEQDTYEKRFPWVNRIKELKAPDKRDTLNAELLKLIQAQDFASCWLAPPEILDWAAVRFFTFSQAHRSEEHTDIDWIRCLAGIDPNIITVDWLGSRRVYCYGDDFQVIADWPLFKCIYAEVELDKGKFLLSAGKWYEVAREFVDEVSQFYRTIPSVADILPVYDDDSEGLYNARIAQLNTGSLILMDRKMVHYGGGRSQIEFCDLLGPDGDIIHVKRYSGSRELSHHFAQALVSGELLVMDSAFRKQVNALLPKSHHIPDETSHSIASKHRIVLAIISRSKKPLNLSFFSKVSLRQAVRRLQAFGFKVVLTKVRMDEVRAKKITFRRRGISSK